MATTLRKLLGRSPEPTAACSSSPVSADSMSCTERTSYMPAPTGRQDRAATRRGLLIFSFQQSRMTLPHNSSSPQPPPPPHLPNPPRPPGPREHHHVPTPIRTPSIPQDRSPPDRGNEPDPAARSSTGFDNIRWRRADPHGLRLRSTARTLLCLHHYLTLFSF